MLKFANNRVGCGPSNYGVYLLSADELPPSPEYTQQWLALCEKNQGLAPGTHPMRAALARRAAEAAPKGGRR